jgi:hypothetical protein
VRFHTVGPRGSGRSGPANRASLARTGASWRHSGLSSSLRGSRHDGEERVAAPPAVDGRRLPALARLAFPALVATRRWNTQSCASCSRWAEVTGTRKIGVPCAGRNMTVEYAKLRLLLRMGGGCPQSQDWRSLRWSQHDGRIRKDAPPGLDGRRLPALARLQFPARVATAERKDARLHSAGSAAALRFAVRGNMMKPL